MPINTSCLLDSNILLRISKGDDPSHPVIAKAIRELIRQGITLCYNSQTLTDFWNVSTRPIDKNGFGLSVADTARLAASMLVHGVTQILTNNGRDFQRFNDIQVIQPGELSDASQATP